MGKPKLKKSFIYDHEKTVATMSIVDPIYDEVTAKSDDVTRRVVDAINMYLKKTKVYKLNTFSCRSESKPDEVDEYSLDKGKDLAGMKCDLKYHKWMFNRYRRLMDELIKVNKNLIELAKYHAEKIEKIEKDIEEKYH